jgi:hypothetical protein
MQMRKASSDNKLSKLDFDNNHDEFNGDSDSEIVKAVSLDDIKAAYKHGKKEMKIISNLEDEQERQKKELYDQKMNDLKKHYFSGEKSITKAILKQSSRGKNYAKIGICWKQFSNGWNKFLGWEEGHPENCVKIFMNEIQSISDGRKPLLDPKIEWSFVSDGINSNKKLLLTWPSVDSASNSPVASRDPSPTRSKISTSRLRSKSTTSSRSVSPDISPSTSSLALEDLINESKNGGI